jgi:hypothetical protein
MAYEALRGAVLLALGGTILFGLLYTVLYSMTHNVPEFPVTIFLVVSFIAFVSLGLGLSLIIQSGKTETKQEPT